MNAIEKIIPKGHEKMGPVAVGQAIMVSRRTAYRMMKSGVIKSVARKAGSREFRVTTDQWLADYLRRENPELAK